MKNNNSVCYLSISELHSKLKNREISAVEIIDSFLDRIKEIDTKLINAFITVTEDIARVKAESVDKKIANNEKLNILDGIPIGIKDIFCTKDIRTTAGSKMLKDFIPNYDACVVEKLCNSGAIILGKLNMDEFAMGSSNLYSAFGSVLNPWGDKVKEKLLPGGSSGGSAASVASFCCVASIGSDTGGSVRQPASFCGIIGLKPTYGRLSRWGMIPMASSLDHPGVFARSIKDVAIMFDAMSGHDYRDSTSVALGATNISDKLDILLDSGLRDLKVAIPKEYRQINGIDDKTLQMWDEAIQVLIKSGAEVEYVSIPYIDEVLSIYYAIVCAESSSNFAKYDGIRYGSRTEKDGYKEMLSSTRSVFFGNEVKRRLIGGALILSQDVDNNYYKKARALCSSISLKFENIFKKFDCMLLPTVMGEAVGIDISKVDPISVYINDVFTIPANLAGLPAISVPFKLSDRGLPLGMQIISKHFNEEILFKVSGWIEHECGVLVDCMKKSEYDFG